MKSKKIKLTLFFVIALMFMLCVNSVAYAKDIQKVEYSKRYQEWLKLSDEEKEKTIAPLPVNIKFEKQNVKNKLLNILKTTQIPEKYDLRDNQNINIEVKNQLQEGACWIFSANSLLELYEAKNGIVSNYSEKHSEYDMSNSFFDEDNPNALNRNAGEGATGLSAFTYYARGTGPILEEYMPFDNSHNLMDYYDLPKNVTAKKVEEMHFFPSLYKKYQNGKVVCVDANDEPIPDSDVQEIRNEIKEHIMKYGGVSANVYGANDPRCYNEETFACNTNRPDTFTNHAVTIIGWDDNYSKDNFISKPSKDGAYIVLNSWGEEFGEQGFYYISYEDFFIEGFLRGIESVSDIDYDNIYQYDTNDAYWEVKNKYSANLFTAASDEKLIEIKLGCMNTKTCNIYVKTGTDNLSINGLNPVAKNISLRPGYNTVKLDRSIQLAKNENFSIIVEVIENDKDGIAIESNEQLSMNNVISHENESFVSDDGLTWTDLYNSEDMVNLSIKAFTQKDTKTLEVDDIDCYLDERINGSIHICLKASYLDNGKIVNVVVSKANEDVTNKFDITQNKIVGKGGFITLTPNSQITAGEYKVEIDVEGYDPVETSFEVSCEQESIITVQFNDRIFYEYVKTLVSRATFDDENMTITSRKTNFDKVKVINIAYKGIIDVTGINYFTKLKSVDISGNNISNYNFLDSMNSNLEVLSLSGVDNNILNKIVRFTHLKKLSILSSTFNNTNFLENFEEIDELWILNCSCSDFSKISSLISLKTIDFRGTKLNNTEFLKNLSNVEVLLLNDCEITDYEFLENLNSLKEIYLHGNVITEEDLKDINKLKNLKFLSIDGEELSNLEFLRNTNLEVLHLSAGFNTETSMYNENDKVTDFSPIAELKDLRELIIENFVNLNDINFLENNKRIQCLSIMGCRVRDARVLDSDIFKDTVWDFLSPAVMSQTITEDIFVGGSTDKEIILKVPPIIEQACDSNSILYAVDELELTGCEWYEKGKSIKVNLQDREDFSIRVIDGRASGNVWYCVIFHEPGIDFIMSNNQRYITTLNETNNKYEDVITAENFPLAKTIEVKDIEGNVLTENSKLGTGTTITLLDKDGVTINTYIVSILGDLDGNGKIDMYDPLKLIELVFDSKSNFEWLDYLKLAGNCDKTNNYNIEVPDLYDILRLIEYYFDNVEW